MAVGRVGGNVKHINGGHVKLYPKHNCLDCRRENWEKREFGRQLRQGSAVGGLSLFLQQGCVAGSYSLSAGGMGGLG